MERNRDLRRPTAIHHQEKYRDFSKGPVSSANIIYVSVYRVIVLMYLMVHQKQRLRSLTPVQGVLYSVKRVLYPRCVETCWSDRL